MLLNRYMNILLPSLPMCSVMKLKESFISFWLFSYYRKLNGTSTTDAKSGGTTSTFPIVKPTFPTTSITSFDRKSICRRNIRRWKIQSLRSSVPTARLTTFSIEWNENWKKSSNNFNNNICLNNCNNSRNNCFLIKLFWTTTCDEQSLIANHKTSTQTSNGTTANHSTVFNDKFWSPKLHFGGWGY